MSPSDASAAPEGRDLSIAAVVPCHNEEAFIALCLDALLRQDLDSIHVVDHGSTDRTVDIVRSYGDRVTLHDATGVGSISEVRNLGARATTAEWIAFIDGDTEVGADWRQTLTHAIRQAVDDGIDPKELAVGSTCTNPPDPSWIQRIWYDQLRARDSGSADYLNGAHTVVSRALFDRIGGFDPEYATGEDVRFCRDIVRHGGSIRKDPAIIAMHHGYPATIRAFHRRERWHGKGMINEIGHFWRERDLSLAVWNLALPTLGLLAGVLTGAWLASLAVVAAGLTLPLGGLATRRARRARDVPGLFALYSIYGWAKSAALLRGIPTLLGRNPATTDS